MDYPPVAGARSTPSSLSHHVRAAPVRWGRRQALVVRPYAGDARAGMPAEARPLLLRAAGPDQPAARPLPVGRWLADGALSADAETSSADGAGAPGTTPWIERDSADA